MMKIFLMSALLLLTQIAIANEQSQWGYDNKNGPTHWGEINTKYTLCKNGKNQSPINITHLTKAPHDKLSMNYQSKVVEILNNGHTIQFNVESGSRIKIDNETFDLTQFHFHSPSENTINGKRFPLEGHFVHTDKKENLAVLSVMFEDGKNNPIVEKLWKKMPSKVGSHIPLNDNITAFNLMPKNKDYYRFNGSLTTPPCSEGVRWYVLKNPLTISTQQIEKFHSAMHHANNRPIQKLNARLVLE